MEQLEDIDNELSKFDNIKISVGIPDNSGSKSYSSLIGDSEVIGPKALGSNSTYAVAKKEGKTKGRGWVYKEQNRGEPSGQNSSLLKKRFSRDDDAKDGITERSRKNWQRRAHYHRQRLGPSPAGINESPSMELLGVWESPCSSRACR